MLKLSTKDGQATSLCCPLQLLNQLEINCQFDDAATAPDDTTGADDGKSEQTDNKVPTQVITCRRSQQLAARQANNQLKACLLKLDEN